MAHQEYPLLKVAEYTWNQLGLVPATWAPQAHKSLRRPTHLKTETHPQLKPMYILHSICSIGRGPGIAFGSLVTGQALYSQGTSHCYVGYWFTDECSGDLIAGFHYVHWEGTAL